MAPIDIRPRGWESYCLHYRRTCTSVNAYVRPTTANRGYRR
jgi:hypothetical protein